MGNPNPSASTFHPDPLPLNHPPTIGWIDDDELGEVHELLWHGYRPEPFERHEWDFGSDGFGHPNPPARLWRSRKRIDEDRREAIEARLKWERWHRDDQERWRQEVSDREYVKANRFRFHWGSLCFVCDRCHGKFTSHASEDQAELDYLKTFAGKIRPVEQRMVLCEGCFDIVNASGGGNARIA